MINAWAVKLEEDGLWKYNTQILIQFVEKWCIQEFCQLLHSKGKNTINLSEHSAKTLVVEVTVSIDHGSC